MKRAAICGVMVLVLVFLAVGAGAVDLNAPGEKKVTVGSEIKRGCSVITEAIAPVDLLQQTMAFDRIISLNHQKNTDSPGFMLGASFAAWQFIAYRLESKIKESSSNNRDTGIRAASLYFRDFRKLQKTLKISDDQLLEATGQIKPFTKDIERWEAKTKGK